MKWATLIAVLALSTAKLAMASTASTLVPVAECSFKKLGKHRKISCEARAAFCGPSSSEAPCKPELEVRCEGEGGFKFKGEWRPGYQERPLLYFIEGVPAKEDDQERDRASIPSIEISPKGKKGNAAWLEFEDRSIPGDCDLFLDLKMRAPVLFETLDAQETRAPAVAQIDKITLAKPCADDWCGGTMVIAGESVLIPRNLILDLPAGRMPLKQLFDQAPPACKALGQTGLARNDTCLKGEKPALATVHANRSDCDTIIAGDLYLQKSPENITGPVTFINYSEGYFRVSGIAGSDSTGVLVRLNDPTGRNTIQRGKACGSGPNCSADPRFAGDTDNYSFAFANGYPMCIPSMVSTPARAAPANDKGEGDAFCPQSNRDSNPVADSRRFAPLRVGDSVTVLGNLETAGGVRFLSAHSATVNLGLTTRDALDQPDYVQIADAEWDLPNFGMQRVRATFGGASTLFTPELDVFALRADPGLGVSHEDPIASTAGNPQTTALAVAGPGGIWNIEYDVFFPSGVPVPQETSPCFNLRNAGFEKCSAVPTLAEEFAVLSPPSREILARSRHKARLSAGVVTLDLNGREAPNGMFTKSLGVSLGGLVFQPPASFNLGAMNMPFVFEGLPWLLDRRAGPGGCAGVGGCGTVAERLGPFPASGIDPRGIQNGVPGAVADRTISAFSLDAGQLVAKPLPFPPPNSCGETALAAGAWLLDR